MPISKPRKKKVSPEETAEVVSHQGKKKEGNPAWLVPTMVTLLILGVAWIVVFYLSSANLGLPIPGIGQWNIAIGFTLMLGGLGLATRWE
ncbi:cell division protein CrgA [Jonesiaceae bacterium BS-20]|uniref:Cell division protein CrgA n=1 Tax=Jonesiaceae bacterium BS-20 TaxID=3120821 RepID=A0AAU7DV88_9MICO